MDYEEPRLIWLLDKDWLRFLIAFTLLAMALLCLICVIMAVFMFVSGNVTSSLFWMLFAVITKPWR